MTNHALVKKKIIANTDGAADCSCNNDLEAQPQWHIMGMGTCNSFPLIRQRFAKMREEMMEDVGIPDNIHKAIVDNHEPNADRRHISGLDRQTLRLQASRTPNCLSVITMLKILLKLVSKWASYEIMDHRQRRNAWRKNSAKNGITPRDGKRQRCGSSGKMPTKGALSNE